MPTGERLAGSLAEARAQLSKVVDGARAILERGGGARPLMDKPGLHFGAAIGIYEKLFRQSGVVTYEALDSLWTKWHRSDSGMSSSLNEVRRIFQNFSV